ncbi:imidazolonepropionase-like amidohydrolase [Kineosphaera limosa]|uniref:Putative peptidase M38 family protein n=1 Tax=Kineosphaera limosa NBRC 100340 TaxID=1184609 RepID=K6VEG4_9MICO|nr:amidohydrolase family protein [Kineosphaera limosa]NYD99425.1 imidazolonepropionase-like amidohydrolase [Kineosphaera limosa]GAB94593.1 putative peptidase M38 family protein [Kineosphaera limosa NBRC 100340]
MAAVLHVRGSVLVGAHDVRDEVWVVGGRITFEPPGGGEVESVSGFVLPGLVDAHCHVGLDSRGAVDEQTALEQAGTERDAGALLLRDAGSPVDTRFLQERDDVPQIIRAGRHIARHRRYIPGVGVEVEPDELVAQVREQARRGDGWVKLVGDWIDRDAGDLRPCWPREALTQAIAAAHEEGARVTAHCFGEESLHDFAAAGTDCIEHASGLSTDSIEAFAAAGIAIVPTLVNIENFPAFADAGRKKFPTYADHMIDLWERRYETIGAAHEAGVPIYAGTDAGGQVAHGLVAQEVAQLVRAGMSNLEAISAATWGAREWLGRPGLTEGAPADLVVYDADPRTDVAALGRPAHIVLRGHLVR